MRSARIVRWEPCKTDVGAWEAIPPYFGSERPIQQVPTRSHRFRVETIRPTTHFARSTYSQSRLETVGSDARITERFPKGIGPCGEIQQGRQVWAWMRRHRRDCSCTTQFRPGCKHAASVEVTPSQRAVALTSHARVGWDRPEKRVRTGSRYGYPTVQDETLTG